MDNKQLMKAMNEQYIQNKRIEIALEETRLAANAKNQNIADTAVDNFTLELMEEGVL